MITANLLGGLSNQMFQIATAYALAVDNNDQCAFPLDRKEMGQGNIARTYVNNVFRNIKELPKGWKPSFKYIEPCLNYVPIPYQPNMMIEGYFPSEKYFKSHKDEICAMYKDCNMILKLKEKYKDILKSSVSMHIRRGDYRKCASILPPLARGYYTRALEYIEDNSDISNILIFSDDIPYCKRRFSDKRVTFVEGNADYIDLYLMTLCNHNIIANSGFSWWGAYLNENKNKIMCVPSIWFGYAGPKGIVDNYLENSVRI